MDEIGEYIRQRMVEETLPSFAVAVARGDEVLWEEAWGWADREARVPATPHTLYSLASISKPICATGLMRLVERGRLDLDRAANDYLGDAPLRARVGDAREATVRRVANHTSGLPLHYHFFPVDEEYPRPPMPETLRRYGYLVSVPGENYQYSNIGYGVLDFITERLSGRAWADFMRAEVFLPLGMTHASVGIGPGLEPHAAARYAPDGARVPFYDFDHPGASAVFCSAHDLLRFGQFHLGARLPDAASILSAETRERMRVPTSVSGEHTGYGVGWGTNAAVADYFHFGHSGGMRGVNTDLRIMPQTGLVVVALCNGNSQLPCQVTERVFRTLVPQYDRALTALQAEKEGRAPAGAEKPPFQPLPELLGEWKGAVHTYERQLPFVLRFQPDGDVHARLGESLTTLVNEPELKDGRLTGKMFGDVGTADAGRRPYHLHLDLQLRGSTLEGAVTAISVPGNWLSNALTSWADLKKVEG